MKLNLYFTEKVPFIAKDALTQKENAEKWSVWSLQGGLQTLIEKLERRLQIDGVEIHTGQTCSQVEFVADELNEENKVNYDHSIVGY